MSTAFHPGHNRSIIRNTFYIQLLAFIMLSLSSSVGSMVDGIVIGQFLGVDSIAAFGIINPLMIAFSNKPSRCRQNGAGPSGILSCLRSVHRVRRRTDALSPRLLRSRHKCPGRLQKHCRSSPFSQGLSDWNILWTACHEPGQGAQRVHAS